MELVLSAASFRDAAMKTRKVRERLEVQCEEFCTALISAGYAVTYSVLASHIDSGQTIGSLEIIEESSGGNFSATLRVSSEAILFLEFGSGLPGLGTAPHASDYGTPMGSGTYQPHARPQDRSGQYDNWNNPDGWFYYKGGKKHHSYGMAASLPMYKGVKEMRSQIKEIAERVFKW